MLSPSIGTLSPHTAADNPSDELTKDQGGEHN